MALYSALEDADSIAEIVRKEGLADHNKLIYRVIKSIKLIAGISIAKRTVKC